MTNPDKHMPDELYVYNDKSSIGDFGFTSMSPKYGYIKYNRASPNQCCGAVGKEACMRRDQDGEECTENALEILDTCFREGRALSLSERALIRNALKTRGKPVEVTSNELLKKMHEQSNNSWSLEGDTINIISKLYPTGIKIIDGGA